MVEHGFRFVQPNIVHQVRAATAQYTDVNVATNEGFFDASGFVPNMGHHYVLPARMDGTFELEKPEIILYAPDSNGNMEFVAVEYAVPIGDLDNPGLPPEGFTGDLDTWEINPNLSQWQLHVWLVKENPDGIFAPTNPEIGDGN
ncbi:hypothetical protein FGM00_18085 [Aggregatimonas sangjinii]|uniref:Uncharacterized protein n=1 Tax=Aggregatimonas sangjinii TaxID=2583587 RepID=A0A5B7SYT6_9FLAO|nr:hypothetical protein FGM00_18085 [Aggregatimonas sangjinii]